MITLFTILTVFGIGVLIIGSAIAVAAVIFTAAGWLAGIAFSALEAILAVYVIIYLIKAVSEAF